MDADAFLLCFPAYTLNMPGSRRSLTVQSPELTALPVFTDRAAVDDFLRNTGWGADVVEYPTAAHLAAFLSLALKYPGGADRWLLIDPPDLAVGRWGTLVTVGQVLAGRLTD